MASMDLDQTPPAGQAQQQQQDSSLPILTNNKKTKRPRLPEAQGRKTHIHRRPLQRPPSAQRPGSPRHIYMSAGTSFMSVVRRVRKQLDRGGASTQRQTTKGLPLQARIEALRVQQPPSSASKDDNDEVLVMGTGRAIEKTLAVAAWFNRQRDCRVSLRTRTVGAVDDWVVEGGRDGGGDDGEDEEEEEQSGSRVRMVSCLEVGVRLR